MDIEGLDYNTKREKLILPEFGREIQKMVDYAISLPDKNERQICAESIIAIMGNMFPQMRDATDYQQKLWDNLAIMSNFKLDIDYPYDVSNAKKISTKPAPMKYPMTQIKIRHYGKMMFELFDKLKEMPDGPEKKELTRITANQMKRDLSQWSHGSMDDEKVANDLAKFTDSNIQLDLNSFEFDEIKENDTFENNKRRKKKF
ncbi:DUF4290 domain-containing protein [Xylanibacter oryzae]|uniref:DUF4290 domain-containing protein n=1 Tax=Xylanibacter oryzae TaxID=185293 RepID=UPI0004BA6532|nr:DUF4290 domain-containing protein [Xylanibacter oryzae]